MFYTALPKWEITLWEFETALNKLNDAKLHWKLPKPVADVVKQFGKHAPTGREEYTWTKKVSSREAEALFKLFDLNGDRKIQSHELITSLAIFAKAETNEDKAERSRLLFKV
jgi:hypothetical protein